MIHELLGINNNKVDLSRVPNINPEAKTVVLTTESDVFYKEHLMDNFGDLGQAVKRLAEKYRIVNEQNSNLDSIGKL